MKAKTLLSVTKKAARRAFNAPANKHLFEIAKKILRIFLLLFLSLLSLSLSFFNSFLFFFLSFFFVQKEAWLEGRQFAAASVAQDWEAPRSKGMGSLTPLLHLHLHLHHHHHHLHTSLLF